MTKQKKTKAEKLKNLKNLVNAINKKEGENVINFASDPETIEKMKIEFLPTKSLALNEAISGYPRGRMTIITGMEDVGKTARILEDIGYNMELDPDLIAGFIESEDSVTDEMLDIFKIDRDRFIFYKVDPDTGAETAFDYAISMAEAGCDIIAINSLKCLTPSKEFKDSVADANVGLQSRINSKFCRKVIPVISKYNTALICTQHKTTNIGKMFGDPMELAGGHALRYNAIMILDLSKISIQKGDMYYDMKSEVLRIKCTVRKNHTVVDKSPYVSAQYTVVLGKGTDTRGEIIQAAFDMGLVEKQGAWIRIYPEGAKKDKGNEMILSNGDLCKFNGMSAYIDYLNNSDELYEYLRAKVGGTSLVNELSEEEIKTIVSEEEYIAQLDEIIDNPEE